MVDPGEGVQPLFGRLLHASQIELNEALRIHFLPLVGDGGAASGNFATIWLLAELSVENVIEFSVTLGEPPKFCPLMLSVFWL